MGVSSSAGVNMDWTAVELPRGRRLEAVLGSDKTVLRGGFAMYHDSAWSQGAQGLWQNPALFLWEKPSMTPSPAPVAHLQLRTGRYRAQGQAPFRP